MALPHSIPTTEENVLIPPEPVPESSVSNSSQV